MRLTLHSMRSRFFTLFLGLATLALMLTSFRNASAALLLTLTPTPIDRATSSITRPIDAPNPVNPDFAGCGGINQPVVNADYEQQVVDLVNTERANIGLPPYKRVAALDEAARYHSADLGQDNYFSHDTYDRSGGTLVFVCDTWTRIGKYYSGATGENIAAGYGTPQAVMTGWMNSSGHKANILSTYSWEIGVGYATANGSTYYSYWTQDFGRRDGAGVYPLIINRDAASTNSRNVSIYIYGSFQQMRLKNDNGSWGAWQPFQNSLAWTLGHGVSNHTVTAELKNNSTTITSSDDIYLSQDTPPQLGNLPDSVTFLYSIPDARLTPNAMALSPANIGGPDPLTWSISKSGTWFSVSPSAGLSPQSFQITPGSFSTSVPITYTGIVTVTVSDPPDTTASPHRIDLTLRVIDTPFHDVFLPLIQR